MSKMNYWKIMTRRKPLPQQECVDESKLGRVFGTFDLTALGVSATLGVGVYVLAGHVAKDQAGPSVILSFLIAAFASFLAGLCYAEFSSRVPKSGSAYIFTYVAIGEFLAFIVGWNLILEYVIGAASISKGLSLYIDSLINDTMKTTFKQIAPMSWDFLESYFDFFAFGGPLLIGLALAFGLRKSAGINNVFCVLNLGVVAYVVIAVIINADIKNWQVNPIEVPLHANSTGTGGFFPFGFSGTLKGAATCFFGFVGFDCIATTGEEVRNPQKTVPRALLYSLLIIFIAYFGVSLLTLMCPYYLLNPEAPLPHAFKDIGWKTSMWVVTIGGIIGLIASLFGALFPLPRILYSMAQDGLIFREFSVISRRFKTPVFGTLCAAVLTSCFSAMFNLAALVSMLSIGVLLAYTVVAISIIILRFSQSTDNQTSERYIETSNLLRPGNNLTTKGFVMQMIRLNDCRGPNTISMWVVGSLIAFYCVVSFALGLTILYSWDALAASESWALTVVFILAALLLLICILISIQPRQKFPSHTNPFKVPLVPFLPAVSVFINIYLMLMLDYYTWVRFGVWMFVGLIVYFPSAWLYNSNDNRKPDDDTNTADEITIEKASSNRGEEVRSNGGASMIKSTCESESVIIVHEKQRSSTSAPESIINNNLSAENEANLAIEMLDTVLEAEDEGDSEEIEINSRRDSSRSISDDNDLDENMPVILSTRELCDEKLPNETRNLEIIDLKVIRNELEAVIDDILERARASVAEIEMRRLNEVQSDDNDENVFRNQKFLNHLNELISKSNQQPSQSNVQSKTLERRKSNVENETSLKHSRSAPDFSLLLELTKRQSVTSLNDETSVEYVLSDDEDDEHSVAPPPAPVFVAELFEKVATLRRKEKIEEEEVETEQENIDEISDVRSPEEETVDVENFRDKLEKLLSVPPPTRLSLIAPTPLPRTSLVKSNNPAKTEDDSQEQQPSPRDTNLSVPISATMLKQRELFDEVLKKLKRNDEESF